MEQQELSFIPKSRLRDCIAIAIFGYCLVQSHDFVMSIMWSAAYVLWSAIPVHLYEGYMRRKAEQNDNQKT